MIDDCNCQDTVISSLPCYPLFLSVCRNLFSSFIDHVQLSFIGTNMSGVKRNGLIYLLESNFLCVVLLIQAVCSAVNGSAKRTLA